MRSVSRALRALVLLLAMSAAWTLPALLCIASSIAALCARRCAAEQAGRGVVSCARCRAYVLVARRVHTLVRSVPVVVSCTPQPLLAFCMPLHPLLCFALVAARLCGQSVVRHRAHLRTYLPVARRARVLVRMVLAVVSCSPQPLLSFLAPRRIRAPVGHPQPSVRLVACSPAVPAGGLGRAESPSFWRCAQLRLPAPPPGALR